MFPYQWMFIFFGIFTVFFGISLWWLLPDSPLTATWLTERERIIAVERLKDNRTGVKNIHHKKAQIKEALCDIKVWMLVFGVFCHNMTNSLQSNFTGLILKGLGYSTYQAVLLSIPPGIIMAATMLSVSFFLSSRWGEGKRIFVIIFCYIPGVIACGMLLGEPRTNATLHARLGAVFIISMVASSAGVMYSLLASNVAGYTKKTVSGALFFSAYCVANIVSPQTFLATQAPRYQTGIAVSLAAFAINIVLFSVLYFVYRQANAARDRDQDGHGSEDDAGDLLNAFSDMTDKENKRMRYKL
jgi:ACS family allantoate permease-like MFS transporter